MWFLVIPVFVPFIWSPHSPVYLLLGSQCPLHRSWTSESERSRFKYRSSPLWFCNMVKLNFLYLQNVSDAVLILSRCKCPSWFHTHLTLPSLKCFNPIIPHEIPTSFGSNIVNEKNGKFLDSNNLDMFSQLIYLPLQLGFFTLGINHCITENTYLALLCGTAGFYLNVTWNSDFSKMQFSVQK